MFLIEEFVCTTISPSIRTDKLDAYGSKRAVNRVTGNLIMREEVEAERIRERNEEPVEPQMNLKLRLNHNSLS